VLVADSYESTLRIHIKPKLGHIRLAKLTATDLERLYADLSSKGAAPKSVRNYHACIHTMLEKAVRRDVLVRNVANIVDLPRKVRRDLPMITPEQAKAFLQATQEHRLEALFVLAITTAARQGELLGLAWDNVDLDTGLIDVRWALQKVDGQMELVEPKTASSVRTIALTEIAIAALRRHHGRQIQEQMYLGRAWVNELNLVFTTPFGTPLDKDNVRKRELPPLLRAAGLSDRLRFHDLRHIAASLLLSDGVPIPTVSEMLGHADSATTLRVYAHAIPGVERQAARALDKLLAE
jgi:integrase